MKPTDTEKLVLLWLAQGNKIKKLPEAPRPTAERLQRTGAEQFFRKINSARYLRQRAKFDALI